MVSSEEPKDWSRAPRLTGVTEGPVERSESSFWSLGSSFVEVGLRSSIWVAFSSVGGYACLRTYSSRMLENGSSCSFFDRFELNLFLIESLVLPSISLAILLQLLPYWQNSLTIFKSSSWVHLALLMFGSKCLYQRSRHYREIRPGKHLDTLFQLHNPYLLTRSISIVSSSLDQLPIAQLVWLFSSSHRTWHLISDLPGIILLMLLHELEPKWLISFRSLSS